METVRSAMYGIRLVNTLDTVLSLQALNELNDFVIIDGAPAKCRQKLLRTFMVC